MFPIAWWALEPICVLRTGSFFIRAEDYFSCRVVTKELKPSATLYENIPWKTMSAVPDAARSFAARLQAVLLISDQISASESISWQRCAYGENFVRFPSPTILLSKLAVYVTRSNFQSGFRKPNAQITAQGKNLAINIILFAFQTRRSLEAQNGWNNRVSSHKRNYHLSSIEKSDGTISCRLISETITYPR